MSGFSILPDQVRRNDWRADFRLARVMDKRLVPIMFAVASCLAGIVRSEEPPAVPGSPPATAPPARREQMRPGGGPFFQSLPPEKQERFLKLLDEWSKLTVEQRQQILNRFEQKRKLSPEQRERLRQGLAHFEEMPAEQRDRIRDHLHKWQQMPPAEREKYRQREQELRQKAEADLTGRHNELNLHPAPEQMRWIRQYYFQKKREMFQKVGQRARELKQQPAAADSQAGDDGKQNLRQQLQQYRQQLEEESKKDFEEFARNPHPLPPPKESRPENSRGGKALWQDRGRSGEAAPNQPEGQFKGTLPRSPGNPPGDSV